MKEMNTYLLFCVMDDCIFHLFSVSRTDCFGGTNRICIFLCKFILFAGVSCLYANSVLYSSFGNVLLSSGIVNEVIQEETVSKIGSSMRYQNSTMPRE
jgi:hypothetical protein